MALLIDGKKISNDIINEMKAECEKLKVKPGLVVVVAGDDPASAVYVRNKEKACDQAGFYHNTFKLPSDVTEEEILALLKNIEADCNVHGVIVQLPLPKHINEERVINAIPIDKDVDCFHPFNVGQLLTKKKGSSPLLCAPCTPAGVMELLDRYDVDIAGKHAVIVGRSNIVGKPLSLMLLNRDATVTICHSRTEDLGAVLRTADIIIAAVGVPKLVRADMVKEGAVVIDVGINRLPDGKLCGDVDFEKIREKAVAITPVPGGVGPMTIAMLLRNTLSMAKRVTTCE
jgi:methylenetetrahydrofolate dehydrogenase (NADP+) / methenyltetrahydrofolate cyclohydrolase